MTDRPKSGERKDALARAENSGLTKPKRGSNKGNFSKLFTPEVQSSLIESAKQGIFAIDACKRAGISKDTLYYWLQRGRGGAEPFVQFAKDYDAAEIQCETGALKKILSSDDPRALQWFLERRHSGKWGYKIRLELQNQLEAKLDLIAAALPRHKYGDAYEVVLRIISGDDDVGQDESTRPLRLNGATSTVIEGVLE